MFDSMFHEEAGGC